MPVKPLSFKGDKKSSKKRKQRDTDLDSTALTTTSSAIHNSSTDPSEDDSWVVPDTSTDLSGPTILVLPTSPPTCLASDAHGNVFASTLENIVENVPDTAEPHEVRQVWVANQVAGTGQVTFKASHGGFLSCDSVGVLGAKREARGTEEGFVVEAIESQGSRLTWRIRTAASKHADGEKGRRYLCAVSEGGSSEEDGTKRKLAVSLRGDGEVGDASIELIVKMQARFKPQLQANKEQKAREKVSRSELERAVGRKLEDDEVRKLKRARKDGMYHEEILDMRAKGKHDKFA